MLELDQDVQIIISSRKTRSASTSVTSTKCSDNPEVTKSPFKNKGFFIRNFTKDPSKAYDEYHVSLNIFQQFLSNLHGIGWKIKK
jgi:hypothetical protein